MITGNIDSFFANIIVSKEARELCPKIDSMYALLPYKHLWQNTLSVYSLTGKTAADSFEAEQILLQEYIDNYSLDRHNAAEAKKALLFTNDGRHITELVNSYYLVGDGEKTAIGINLPNDVRLASTVTTPDKSSEGDGMVSLYSATAGDTLPNNRTFIKRGGDGFLSDHESLAGGGDVTTLEFIIRVLEGKVKSLSDRDLKNDYNIKHH